MKIQVLKVKLHKATLTGASVDYHGSLSIDEEIMERCGLRKYEKVLVGDMNNGARFETYAIPAPRGSRAIEANGGVAHLVKPGDRLVVMVFALVDPEEDFRPRAFVLDEQNNIVEELDYS
jgi:aspartate 1-decarboxylase